MAYPTPPPTDSNSPSHTHTTYKVPSYFAASQNPLQYSSYTSSAYQPQTQTPRHTQSYGPPATASAQDSYFHSYSAPNSPLVPPSQPYSVPAFPPKPERRQTSPIQSVSRPYSPLRASRTSSPPRRRSPGNPNYYSTSPLPLTASPKPPGRLSPYSLNRPQKRPGFWARILQKFASWIRSFQRWAKENPIKAGILTFFPVMTVAGVMKIGRMVGKGMGFVQKQSNIVNETRKGVRGSKDEYGFGLDKFVDFNGTKGGPVDGMLKVLQMLM